MGILEKIGSIIVAWYILAFINGMMVLLYPPFGPGIGYLNLLAFGSPPFVGAYLILVRNVPLAEMLKFMIAMVPFFGLAAELLRAGYYSPIPGLFEVYAYRTLLVLGVLTGAYVLMYRLRVFDRLEQMIRYPFTQ